MCIINMKFFGDVLVQEVISLQSHRRLNFEVFVIPNLGLFGQNNIWVQAPWLGTKNTIKRKVVAPPSSGCGESGESMFACGLSVHQKCSNYALTNMFGLCNSM